MSGIQYFGLDMATKSLSGKDQRRVPLCPHKKTDFRYQLWIKDRNELKAKAKKRSFRVDLGPSSQPKKNAVLVDTSKARSNLDVVRLCLHDLGWREVKFN